MKPLDPREQVVAASERIAAAIAARDVEALATELDRDFVHRTPGGESQRAPEFLRAIAGIPGEILFVRLEGLAVEVSDRGAVVTGIQHARVRVDGEEIDDRRGFVDWFVERDGTWRLRVAVDLPG